MSKVKSNLIKLFSCLFAVCTAFAIASMPKSNVVGAAENDKFEVIGTCIRYENDGISGLRFNIEVGDAWFEKKGAEKYSLGTIICPTENLEGNFSKNNSLKTNLTRLDGDNIIFSQNASYDETISYTASIVYDEQVVADYIAEMGSTVSVDEILTKLYQKSFTAIPYAICDGDVTYANPYSESVYNTAILTLEVAENEAVINLAKGYLDVTSVAKQSAYVDVNEKVLVVDSVEGFQVNEQAVVVADGNVLALNQDYTIDQNGKIVFAGEITSSNDAKTIYVINNGTLNAVDVVFADKVLTTAEEVQKLFDFDSWDEDDARISNSNKTEGVYILSQDIDMAGYTFTNSTAPNFYGCFDGRGYAIKNATVTTAQSKNYGFFGNLKGGSVVRNVAFIDIATTTPAKANGDCGLFTVTLEGLMDNVYVKLREGMAFQGLFREVLNSGKFSNSVVEVPFDANFDIATFQSEYYEKNGVGYIASRLANCKPEHIENVATIGSYPLVYYSAWNSSSYNDVIYTDGAVSDWGDFYVYGENQTELWDANMPYFYRATADKGNTTNPGLGIEEGQATIENTQYYVEVEGEGLVADLTQGKTRVFPGIKCYETAEQALDNNNALVKSIYSQYNLKYETIVNNTVVTDDGVEVENSSITLQMSDTTEIGVTYGGVSATEIELSGFDGYATLEGMVLTPTNLGSFDLAISYVVKGVKHVKVINVTVVPVTTVIDTPIDYEEGKSLVSTLLNGKKVLAVTVDGAPLTPGEGYTVDGDGCLATIPGVAYRVNGGTQTFEIVVNTEGGDYIFSNVNYWNIIIDDGAELKGALDVQYGSTAVEEAKGLVYVNGYVYNAGIYKIADTTATIDMAGITMDYTTLTSTNEKENGGFAGYFDGNGCIIQNFAPGEKGMFGVISSYKLTVGATIKNVAFTNVTLPKVTTDLIRPVLFSYVTDGEQNQNYIENVYVKYADDTDDVNGLMAGYYKNLNMNNVFVVSNSTIREVKESFKKLYLDAEGNSIGLEANKKYFNTMRITNNDKTHLYTSTLVANVRYITSVEEMNKLQNVIVASNAPITYNMHNITYLSYLYRKDATNKKYYMDANWADLGQYKSGSSTTRTKQHAYAGNEVGDKGNYPIINDFAYNVKDEIATADFYDSWKTSMHLYYCPNCYTATVYVGGTCPKGCVDAETSEPVICSLDVRNESYPANGITYGQANTHTSPVLFAHIFHDLTKFRDKIWSADSGVVVFNNVSRYDSVDAMKTQNVDYTSFTGANGNGMWDVVEGELVWVGGRTA